MLGPLSAPTFTEALRLGAEIYHELGFVLLARRLSRAVGDEGGHAARLGSTEEALDLLLDATMAAGYEPGADVAFAIDAAASELADDDGYELGGDTEDATIADLAVGAGCPFVKAGAPVRACKDNRLLRIEEELGADAPFASSELPASAFTGSA
jgi:enolase